MSMIDIPESLQFYYGSAGNAQAIDALVHNIQTGNDGPTEDMGWKDLTSYHQALLAAYQVRVDLWQFYKALWEDIWSPTIVQSLPSAFQKWEAHEYEGGLSLTGVWNGCLYKGYRLGDDEFVTSVETDWKQIFIAFYYGNDSDGYGQSNRLELDSSFWKAEPDEEEYRVSKSALAEVRTKRQVDTSRLQAAAVDAVRALNQ